MVVEPTSSPGDNNTTEIMLQDYQSRSGSREDLFNHSEHSKLDLSQHDIEMIEEDLLGELPEGKQRFLGIFSTVVLFVSRIVGSGIFATPSLIYNEVGACPGLFFLVWFIAFFMAFAGLYLFLELGSIVPRNGGIKVFLEYIYYKPHMLMSVIVGVYSIFFGFAISNSIIFGEYFLYSINVEKPSEWASRMVGVVLIVFTTVIHGISVQFGVRVQNFFGVLKIFLLIAIALSGLYALILPEKVSHLERQLHWDQFFTTKQKVSLSSFISAVFKAIYSLAGWSSVHSSAGEVKNPNRTFKIAGPSSLAIISICYIMINFAYLMVIPSDEILNSGQLIGGLLFEKILGEKLGRTLLGLSIAISAGGNTLVVLYNISRVDQEVFREGFLPLSKYLAANWPFGAPLPALLVPAIISSSFLIFTPPGNVYDYIINLESYVMQVFIGLVAVGAIILRRRFPDSVPAIKSPLVFILVTIVFSIFIILGPLLPGDKSANSIPGLPSYPFGALFLIVICVFYWGLVFKFLPWIRGYRLVVLEEKQDDGLIIKTWHKDYHYSNTRDESDLNTSLL
ncbi:Low-affinity methionine permease [Komagataella phaffii CBS 7435]|uniref:Low-affinity methionine permease n=2 Tax=Komagataella phaffii TaxID=460519 RepID=F2QNU4_KOMPC|nr:Low affinity methionine permease, similar to Mup1p [Komagataella phaffii GS115]AOA60564.1 GQ67_02804T0 [Komagataella phaffii]CAH2446264.1 Low-affinity methionine permease [Komagataella phaffii CBS 7435]AOA66559.1 GQ68_02444T0 [Komagataella phaffii GS115]CAY67591.1 Low affinity methionine permease, similar to Mup1p [Komagataella phaffii GS115]CCA36686.1 Low-affinity methionine permease [Komagataella phaffii CBS 7435]